MSDSNRLYYFDDKDLFDAIFSSRRNVSDLFLRDQALERGVFFSYNGEEHERRYISDFYSTWFNDYETLCKIQEKLSIGQRRPKFEPERITPVETGSVILPEKIQEALQACKDGLAGKGSQSFDFSKNTDGSYSGVFNHVEIDYSQTTLRQEKRRTDSIVVRPSENGSVEVSAPSGAGGDTIKNLLVANLAATTRAERYRVELKGDATAEERFEFFQAIIQSMKDMTLETVTELRLSSEDVQTDDAADVENDQQAARDFTKLLKAHLQGSNLFETDEFKDLKENGFFPFEVRWWARDNTANDLIEFSAGFAEAKIGKGFRCDALAVKKWRVVKKENYKSKESLEKDLHARYRRLLETTVYAAIDKHHFYDVDNTGKSSEVG